MPSGPPAIDVWMLPPRTPEANLIGAHETHAYRLGAIAVFDSVLVQRALERELALSARAGRPVSIELVVRDASTVVPEAARLDAAEALEAFGLGGVPITLVVEQRRC